MAQRRATGFRILPSAWHSWEGVDVPERLEAVVEALFALRDSEVVLERLRFDLPVWRLSARREGGQFILVGARDSSGAWVHVVAVTVRYDPFA